MSTTTIVVDPLTRIEGHLRIELDVSGNTVSQARSSGTSFRGIENVLRNRDPRDAPMITQRVCGVCPIPHARAASEAFENAAQNAGSPIPINDQARLIRNIVQATNFLDSHIFHFYVMSMPDFIAGMPTAGAWPQNLAPKPWKGGESLNAQTIANNAKTALAVRRACVAITVWLVGKMPHGMGIVPGGATVTPTSDMIADLNSQITTVLQFVQGAYSDDVGALAAAFPEYTTLGVTGCSLLCYGGLPDGQGNLLFPKGVLAPGASTPVSFDSSQNRRIDGEFALLGRSDSVALDRRHDAGARPHRCLFVGQVRPTRRCQWRAPALRGRPARACGLHGTRP